MKRKYVSPQTTSQEVIGFLSILESSGVGDPSVADSKGNDITWDEEKLGDLWGEDESEE